MVQYEKEWRGYVNMSTFVGNEMPLSTIFLETIFFFLKSPISEIRVVFLGKYKYEVIPTTKIILPGYITSEDNFIKKSPRV